MYVKCGTVLKCSHRFFLFSSNVVLALRFICLLPISNRYQKRMLPMTKGWQKDSGGTAK